MRKITTLFMLVSMIICSCTPAKIVDKKDPPRETQGIAYIGIVPTLRTHAPAR